MQGGDRVIYEKRGFEQGDGTAVKVLPSEMCEGVKTIHGTCSVTEYERQAVPPVAVLPVSRRKLKKIAAANKKRQMKKHIPRKIMLGMCTLLFCAFTLDNRLYDGKLWDKVRNYAVAVFENSVEYGIERFFTQPKDVKDEKEQYFTEDEELVQHGEYSQTDSFNNTQIRQVVFESNKKVENSESDDEAVTVTENENGAAYSDGELYYPITTLDLSAQKVTDLTNGTIYNPDTEKILNTYPSALENVSITDEPLVLIVHTHACESYTEYTDMYPEGENTRTEDMEKNVVRVGEELASTLENYGIGVIHCRTLCDKESFIDAYNVSHDEVQRYLEEYPSIKIVIDVHRDAIIRQSGESIRPAVNIAGQDYAQLMFVVGTGQAAHSHPDWEQNLSLAMHIQSKSQERYPGLFRPINLRSVPFNQWLSMGYLLLEVGSNSNKLEEAVLSAQALGVTLSEVLKESSATS